MNTKTLKYEERVSSTRTLLLFVFLMLLFGGLCANHVRKAGLLRGWGIVFLCLALFFLFYIVNYRVLVIRITADELILNFGLFTWHISLSNIETCRMDTTSLWRIGGAGIHFSPIGGRYRAMFNFLQYPRVVVCLKEKKGLVRDVAFTTRDPDQVMGLLER